MINHFPAFHNILFSVHPHLFLTHVPGLIDIPSPLLHFNPVPCFIRLPIVITNKFILQAAASVKMPIQKQVVLSLPLSGTLETHMVPQLEL